jgi:predicted DNA-binding transcriptional regulator AlpA
MNAAQHSMNADVLATEAQVALLLQLSVRTLQAWRVRGGGPRFVRAGRAVRYRHRDILAWMEARTAASTTAADVL